MKKNLKIIGIFFLLLIVLAIALSSIADEHDGVRQAFKFTNTSNGLKSVTFEKIRENGILSDTLFVNENVKPNESIIKKIPEGKYEIKVWGKKDSLYKQANFNFKIDKSNNNLYRFDLAMDKNYYIVNLNALYSGNSFAENMSDVVGTNYSEIRIEQIYKEKLPFIIPKKYINNNFVIEGDKLPTQISSGNLVYGLYNAPNSVTEKEAVTLINDKILDLEGF